MEAVPHFILLKVRLPGHSHSPVRQPARPLLKLYHLTLLCAVWQNGEVVQRVEGADAAGLTQAVQRHFGSQAASASAPGPAKPLAPAPAVANPAANGSLDQRLQALVNKQPIMLFMKACIYPASWSTHHFLPEHGCRVVAWLQGSPEAPRCGFSKKVVGILRSLDEDFGSFDVLSDEGVRQGIKKFSDWPTFPQLFVRRACKAPVMALMMLPA